MALNVADISERDLEFIRQHQHDDVAELALSSNYQSELSLQEVLHQISSRKKAKHKLPEFVEKEFWFPKKLSLEQASSEATALYKASLVAGDSLADLSGGFGIDFYYMSQQFKEATYIEKDPDLYTLAQYNYKQAEGTISFENTDSETFLQETNKHFSVLYVDPARRDSKQKKVFLWENCSPDVKSLLSLLVNKADLVLIKASPVMDISRAINDLNHYVHEVHVVEYQKEVKEVLYLLKAEKRNFASVIALQLNAQGRVVQRLISNPNAISENYTAVSDYLYEPSPAVMKSQLFKEFSEKYGIQKLSANSHLFSSDKLIENIMAKRFKVIGCCNANHKSLKGLLPELKATLAIRNFPGSVSILKKKLKLQDSDQFHVFATRLHDGKNQLIVCERL